MSNQRDIVDRMSELLGESTELGEARTLIEDKIEQLEQYSFALSEDAGLDESAIASLIESDYEALDAILEMFGFELSEEVVNECGDDDECDCKDCEKKKTVSEARNGGDELHLDSLRREFRREAEFAGRKILDNAFNFRLYNDASSAARSMIASFRRELMGVMGDAIEVIEDAEELSGTFERVHGQLSYEFAQSMLDFCNHLRRMYEDAANETESGSNDGWSDSERESVVIEYEDAIRVIEREMSPYHPANRYRLL